MKFRIKAFGLHVLASAIVLTLVFGTLYLGWYRWPGWYLTSVLPVSGTLAVVDLSLGPLLTLLIANPAKPRRELARDIAVIATAQLVALAYGSATLWSGRPLFYTFSSDRLEIVRAFEIDTADVAKSLAHNPEFAPHWYSRPRWVWAPLPSDPKLSEEIVRSASGGGADVVDMPQNFRPWSEGLPELRKQLKKVADIGFLTGAQKEVARARMHALGYPPNSPVAMIMPGRTAPLLALFDPATATLKVLVEVR